MESDCTAKITSPLCSLSMIYTVYLGKSISVSYFFLTQDLSLYSWQQVCKWDPPCLGEIKHKFFQFPKSIITALIAHLMSKHEKSLQATHSSQHLGWVSELFSCTNCCPFPARGITFTLSSGLSSQSWSLGRKQSRSWFRPWRNNLKL